MGARQAKLNPLRVVLDTNVVLSALVFAQGRLAWLRIAWQSGVIVPLVSKHTAEELIAVLAYPKFKLARSEREALLADYLPYCETVTLSEPLSKVPECRDPDDLPFMQLALAADADGLVTGDNDILSLAKCFSVPIITAEALQRQLAG